MRLLASCMAVLSQLRIQPQRFFLNVAILLRSSAIRRKRYRNWRAWRQASARSATASRPVTDALTATVQPLNLAGFNIDLA